MNMEKNEPLFVLGPAAREISIIEKMLLATRTMRSYSCNTPSDSRRLGLAIPNFVTEVVFVGGREKLYDLEGGGLFISTREITGDLLAGVLEYLGRVGRLSRVAPIDKKYIGYAYGKNLGLNHTTVNGWILVEKDQCDEMRIVNCDPMATAAMAAAVLPHRAAGH